MHKKNMSRALIAHRAPHAPTTQPESWGCMIPDHIASQFLTSGIGIADKVQRNTQAELLAVLTTILMWREELAGSCLVIPGNSTSSETNLTKCTAGNQHS